MPTLFDQTWQDNAGDTVSASDLNSHASEHSNALVEVEEGGTVIGGIGRDQPINITGSGASVSKSNGEIVVDVTDTDTQLSNEQVEDIVAGRLSGGSNVTITHDDPNDTITVDATDTNTDTRVETQAGGTQQYADTSTINFDSSSSLSVTDNGSGKITVAASGGGGSVSDSGNVLGGTAQSDDRSIAVGAGADSSNSIRGITIGDGAISGGVGDIIIGDGDCSTGGGDNIAIGDGASTSGSRSIAIGNNADGGTGDGIAVGGSSQVTDNAMIHITTDSGGSVSGFNSACIGTRGFSGLSVSTDDVMRLASRQLVVPAFNGGTIADADLNNQEVTVEANSAEDALTFRYKTSGGTVKTGTVSLT